MIGNVAICVPLYENAVNEDKNRSSSNGSDPSRTLVGRDVDAKCCRCNELEDAVTVLGFLNVERDAGIETALARMQRMLMEASRPIAVFPSMGDGLIRVYSVVLPSRFPFHDDGVFRQCERRKDRYEVFCRARVHSSARVPTVPVLSLFPRTSWLPIEERR